MRYVTYSLNGNDPRVGAVEDDTIVDLQAAYAQALVSAGDPRARELAALRIPADMTRFIGGLEPSWSAAKEALAFVNNGGEDGLRAPLADAKLHAPLMPPIIFNSGQNYWDHRDEKPVVDQKDPEFFLKAPLAVIGPDEPVIRDEIVTKKLDYEVELAVVIGKPGRHIPKEKALEHVFGYTVANDITARDRQAVPHPEGGFEYALGPGKNFDTAAPLGPWIVTRDEIDDPQALGVRTYVNDELRQSNSTEKMIWDVVTLIEFFSHFYTLQPGIVLETGTPGGTAWATDPEIGGKPYGRSDDVRGSYLEPGDRVTVEIDSIGSLSNPIVEPS